MRRMFIFAAFFLTSLCYADSLRVSSLKEKIQFDIRTDVGPLIGELSRDRTDECKRIVFERGSDLPAFSDGVDIQS